MNNSKGNGNGNGQLNSPSSPSTIDIQNLENEPELPRAGPRSTGTLVAPGPGVSGPVASLPTFTTANAAGITTLTTPVAAASSEPTNGAGTEETPTPGVTAPFNIDDAATDPDVDPALAARELLRGLEEYVRAMNNLGPQRVPPGAAIVPVMAPPPFGVGVFAPTVTVTAAAQVVNVAATAPAINGGVAAAAAPAHATNPTAAPAPIPIDPGSAAVPRSHSHGGAAFDENGQLRVRPDGSLYLEHTPPSTESPSPPPTTAADPTAPEADPSSRPLTAPYSPGIAASSPHPPAISITPTAAEPAPSTGNTPEPEPEAPEFAEFFDFGAAAE